MSKNFESCLLAKFTVYKGEDEEFDDVLPVEIVDSDGSGLVEIMVICGPKTYWLSFNLDDLMKTIRSRD